MGHTSRSVIDYYFLLLSFLVVSQAYISRVHEIDVILGNSGLLKCEIPSFVVDFVSVVSWIDDAANEYFSKSKGINYQS